MGLWIHRRRNLGAAGAVAPVMLGDRVAQQDNCTKDIECSATETIDNQLVADDVPDDSTQEGVRRMQLTRKFWTKRLIYPAYAMMWLILFTDALQQGMASNLTPYITSNFQSHSLTAATTVMSSIIGGLAKLPLAKVVDIWGRPQGFAMSFITLVVGLIMMALCQNVQTYAASQVFYWVGYNGMAYSLQLFMVDTSAIEKRAVALAFSTSPYIITAWASGPLSTVVLNGIGFRWGFGAFAIITPLVCLPLMFLFAYQHHIAKRGLAEEGIALDEPDSPEYTSLSRGKRIMAKTKRYCIEFDVVGLLLLMIGLAAFLLPFSINANQPQGWKSPLVLALLICGLLFTVAFGLWERYGAPVTLMPFSIFTDRTIVSSCFASAGLFVAFNIWDSFFASFLQVVQGISMENAGYIMKIFSVGSCFSSLVVAWVIAKTGKFKYLAVFCGVPVTIIGVGLVAHFRHSHNSIVGIIIPQVMIAVAGGVMVICDQMAVMATVPHKYLAVAVAIENMFANIGGGIGSSVASALWTGVFPKALAKHLPDVSEEERAEIYGDLVKQLSFEKGTPIRNGIDRAYSDAMFWTAVSAVVSLSIPFICVLLWRNVSTKSTNVSSPTGTFSKDEDKKGKETKDVEKKDEDTNISVAGISPALTEPSPVPVPVSARKRWRCFTSV